MGFLWLTKIVWISYNIPINTTVNISIPTKLYKDAKRFAAEYGYSSMSELIRQALRIELYSAPELGRKGKALKRINKNI